MNHSCQCFSRLLMNNPIERYQLHPRACRYINQALEVLSVSEETAASSGPHPIRLWNQQGFTEQLICLFPSSSFVLVHFLSAERSKKVRRKLCFFSVIILSPSVIFFCFQKRIEASSYLKIRTEKHHSSAINHGFKTYRLQLGLYCHY